MRERYAPHDKFPEFITILHEIEKSEECQEKCPGDLADARKNIAGVRDNHTNGLRDILVEINIDERERCARRMQRLRHTPQPLPNQVFERRNTTRRKMRVEPAGFGKQRNAEEDERHNDYDRGDQKVKNAASPSCVFQSAANSLVQRVKKNRESRAKHERVRPGGKRTARE